MTLPEGPSLTRRAALAVGLWAGFYLLALGLAGGLLLFAASLTAWKAKAPPALLLTAGVVSVGGAALILWSIVPRWERARPPGSRLDPKLHPGLFEQIRSLARETRQRPPAEIYLTFEVNASVSHRGGLLGFFTRRIMTVGLPLLKILSRSEFRSVLAHEFGHFGGGDTRLGPWIYRTHAAIQRTLDTLEGQDSIWRFPFVAYARLFARVSHAVSQRQELAADRLAARAAGAAACASALRRIAEGSAALPGFLQDELLPLLNAGHRAPLCEGFGRYLESKEVARAVMKFIGRELSDRSRDPLRTHPPLAERLRALGNLPPGPAPSADEPAIGLLADLDRVERDVLRSTMSNPGAADLPLIAWSEAAEKAFLPLWKEQARAARHLLAGVVPRAFPDLRLAELGRRLGPCETDPEARAAAMGALGAALMASLRERGWELRLEPGGRPAASRDGLAVEPFHVFYDLAEGSLTREAWRERCDAGGFGALDLGA